ncbi:MAG: PA2778 family cysteine peptidase [Burkholderiales bacterium]|nr:PA2778 family cysteine peptidase [Burkholderiales bacterium]
MKAPVARRLSPALAGVFVCAALWLTGCATPQVSALATQWPQELPAQVQLSNTPFFAQNDFECGPAALAMAFAAAGVPVTPDALVEQVYLPGRKGALQVEMLASTRRNGLLPYVLAPELDAVLREVAAGHPVVVFQNLSLPVYPVWHYAVVIGFERERNVLRLHSGTSENTEISLYAFERTWERGGYWAMVALQPDALPATAQPDPLAQAIASLERVNPQRASLAYATALRRWPTHKGLMLGAGNAAYALGQTIQAQQAYARLVQIHPDFADGWNNLAQSLKDLNRPVEARTAIDRAVALGGPRLSGYLELQHSLPPAH